MRTSAKRDITEPAIVEALQKAGCTVKRVSSDSIPDLLVVLPSSETVLVECKSKGGRLTPAQQDFLSTWPGRVIIAFSPEQALQDLGLAE